MRWLRRAFVLIWSLSVATLSLRTMFQDQSDQLALSLIALAVSVAALFGLARGHRSLLLGAPIALLLYKVQLCLTTGDVSFVLSNLMEAGIVAYFFVSVHQDMAPEIEDSLANLKVFHS